MTEKPRRGFASMDPERRRAIAAAGGRAVPAEKRTFARDSELAAAAGRVGGTRVDPAKRSFSRDHALASSAGAKGGAASQLSRKTGADKGHSTP